jgi:hypothetical protein
MPSPSTPRRPSNRESTRSTPSKPKPVDTKPPLGVYDTNSVRDRIRQWQEQGGGVLSGSDVGVENEEENVSVRKGHREKEPVGKESPSASAQCSGRSRDVLAEHDDSGERSGSAPPKRVVSDEHWRKNRSTSRTPVSETTAKFAKIDDHPMTPTRDARSGRRRRSERRTSGQLSGGEIKRTPPSSRRKTANASDEDNDRRGGRWSEDEEPVLRLSPSPPQRDASDKQKDITPEITGTRTSAKKGESRYKRRSQLRPNNIETSPETHQIPFSSYKGSGHSPKVSVLSEIFDGGKTQSIRAESPPTISTQRVPSIEAWLHQTPDPFVDEPEPNVDIPAPLKTHSSSKRISVEESIPEDPNQIWEAVEKSGSQRRRSEGRRRRQSRTPVQAPEEAQPTDGIADDGPVRQAGSSPRADEVERDIREESPSALRRSKATRRRVSSSPRTKGGSSPLKDSFAEEEETSAAGTPPESPGDSLPLEFARPAPLNIRRSCPPTGGHRLSTIASVDTLRTSSELQDAASRTTATSLPHRPGRREMGAGGAGGESKGDSTTADPPLPREEGAGTGLKRRLTTHADLISVLSLPQAGKKSIRSARSIRTNRSRLATATIGDLMQELATDESKYARELRTLVDGVIPVLLTCVLSKNDSSVAAGLFRSSGNPNNGLNFTKPIVDMGIALERLKTLHKRIPQQDPDRLLAWAQGAQKVYADYLKAWRLGFQDVVVNLAPADTNRPGSPSSDPHELDDGMARDADGDVINGDGEKVDVAFLLKRPLVRLKYLSKTFKGINSLKPSTSASDIAAQYQKLVDDARRRSNEERARLEDEAASNIDPTRARDLRTLAVLADTAINRTRTVRARDYFNLTLHHSTGQRVDCRAELLLRDNRQGQGKGGDLLICEVDESGKWLLFPPFETERLSARNGDLEGEIIVMIRGIHGQEEEWRELLLLKTEDEQAGFEWVQMLGLTPVPPELQRSQSFISKQRETLDTTTNRGAQLSAGTSTTPGKSRTPTPGEIEVPIGEQASVISRSRRRPTTPKKHQNEVHSKTVSSPTHDSSPRSFKQHLSSWMGVKSEELGKPIPPPKDRRSFQQNTEESRQGSSDVSPSSLKRSSAKRISRHIDDSPPNSHPTRSALSDPELTPSSSDRRKDISHEWTGHERQRSKTPEPVSHRSLDDGSGKKGHSEPRPERPQYHRSRSSVPSLELPTIPKLRKSSSPVSPLPTPTKEEQPLHSPKKQEATPGPTKLQKKATEKDVRAAPFTEDVPTPPPHWSSSPVPPPHRSEPSHRQSPSPVQLKAVRTPKLSSPTSATRGKRRSSSPLKHQYEPSTASESSSESEESTRGDHDISSESDLSDEEELEDGDVPTPLPPAGVLRQFSKRTPPASLPTLASATLAPSNSASQAPYKTVPSQPSKSSKVIASIFTWSDRGYWESLHEDECSIVITPGLIEAYEMTASHSKRLESAIDQGSDLSAASQEDGDRPLVAVELTPLVPLRRGTALDISIRSPPTDRSKIKSSNNIMFRSRNPEECEYLYSLINQSRINNPTYIALANARGPFSAQGPAIGRHSTVRHSRSSSWFGLGAAKKGYRASSAPTPSIAGASESSVGTMASAFSALRGFGASSKMFNISRSTVTSRRGSRPASLYSSSSGSGTGSGSGSNTPAPANPGPDGAIGLTNAKIRLYARETASKWRDMGAARLTITKPPPGMMPLRPPVGPGSLSSPSRLTGQEKRIIIHGKSAGEILLDACLGESCFERIARTGIAVSVWEEMVGPNGEVGVVAAVGGVGGTRSRIYMLQVRYDPSQPFDSFSPCLWWTLRRVRGLVFVANRLLTSSEQMKSEAEAAYTFSLVGKLRY